MRTRLRHLATAIVLDLSFVALNLAEAWVDRLGRPRSSRARMSLMSDSSWAPDAWMSFTYSSCFSFSSPNIRSVRTSEKPMTAFSGVRSSWDARLTERSFHGVKQLRSNHVSAIPAEWASLTSI
jgi:hypothetical protein